jgi:hypothetical protein
MNIEENFRKKWEDQAWEHFEKEENRNQIMQLK